jgi:hypothetical protein
MIRRCTLPGAAAAETAALKNCVTRFPPADVARSFLPVAVGELSSFENQRVCKAPTDTQAETDRILRGYKKA